MKEQTGLELKSVYVLWNEEKIVLKSLMIHSLGQLLFTFIEKSEMVSMKEI